MTHRTDGTVFERVMELLTEAGFGGFCEAFTILMNEAMKAERSDVLGASPYERTEERKGHANGFKTKAVRTRMGEISLKIPQVRGDLSFYPSSLERGVRSERALKLAVAEMYVQGVATRRVSKVLKELCGLDISSTDVSRAARLLDDELSKWRDRPLGETPYLIVDARYEDVRHAGSVVSCAVLIAAGVDMSGKRTILGVSVSLSEAECHWRDFLKSLQERGLHGVKYVVSDDHSGLKAALKACLPGAMRQRCQFHLQQNAGHYVPKVSMRKTVARDIRDVFNAPDRQEADRRLAMNVEKYKTSAPKLSHWMEKNLPEGLTVFALPTPHHKRMRTTNMLERVNREVARRTRVATLFPNEPSTLRLVSAVLMEISEEWETGKVYLKMENETEESSWPNQKE